VLVLFTRDLQSSFFSFRGEGPDLKGLSLKERRLDLRESLSLRSDSSSPKDFSLVESSFHLGRSPP